MDNTSCGCRYEKIECDDCGKVPCKKCMEHCNTCSLTLCRPCIRRREKDGDEVCGQCFRVLCDCIDTEVCENCCKTICTKCAAEVKKENPGDVDAYVCSVRCAKRCPVCDAIKLYGSRCYQCEPRMYVHRARALCGQMIEGRWRSVVLPRILDRAWYHHYFDDAPTIELTDRLIVGMAALMSDTILPQEVWCLIFAHVFQNQPMVGTRCHSIPVALAWLRSYPYRPCAHQVRIDIPCAADATVQSLMAEIRAYKNELTAVEYWGVTKRKGATWAVLSVALVGATYSNGSN